MPPSELEEVLRAIDAELARRSLADFVRQAWHVVEPTTELIWGWHLDALCEHLQAVTEGKIRNLLINIPPGHMKSLVVCVFWPAWVWLRNPGWRALCASYSGDLALRDSVKCRTLIESSWYRETFKPDWELSEDQNTKTAFQNTKFGGRMALSVGGKVTGFRGDAAVVDDPHNATEVDSKILREAALDWFDKALSTRLNDPRKGVKVVIMQRLHEGDLAGHILEQGGYEHLCLPAIFEPDRRATTSIGWSDPRQNAGELLFPEMFTEEVLGKLKRELGSTAFAGQFQQRPQAAEGGLFKREWWRFWKPDGVGSEWKAPRPKGCTDVPAIPLPSKFDETLASWDCTFKGNDDSDFVAGGVISRKGADFFVRVLWHKRATFTETLPAVRDLAGFPGVRTTLVEDKANGSAVIDTLKSEVSGLIAVNPEGGKESRAAAMQPGVEAGQWYLPEGAPWLERWVEEFAAFPKGKNDDIVDMASQAAIRMLPSRTSFAARFRAHVQAGKGVPGLRVLGK